MDQIQQDDYVESQIKNLDLNQWGCNHMYLKFSSIPYINDDLTTTDTMLQVELVKVVI